MLFTKPTIIREDHSGVIAQLTEHSKEQSATSGFSFLEALSELIFK